jgi:5-formaminoimidazole-4-carboxamide-1-beta-D-ribofuranosyl 5'-monophosphate synthetase
MVEVVQINSNIVCIKIFPDIFESHIKPNLELRSFNHRKVSNISSKLTLPSMINIDTKHTINGSLFLAELHDVHLVASLHVFQGVSAVRERRSLVLVKFCQVFVEESHKFLVGDFNVREGERGIIIAGDLDQGSWSLTELSLS